MDFLLSNADSIEDDEQPVAEEAEEAKQANVAPFFSRHGPFVSFRQYRQQRFQPNQRVRSIDRRTSVDLRFSRPFNR